MAEYVRDEFGRTVASGWGTADVGGAWSEFLSPAGPPASAVSGGTGRITWAANVAAQTANERLAVSTLDSSGSLRFRTSSSIANHVTVVQPRTSGAMSAPTSYYIGCVLVFTTGTVRFDVGTFAAPSALAVVTVPGLVPAVNTWYQLEWELVGAPTRLRFRVWDTTGTVPDVLDGWFQVMDDTTGPQTAGELTVRLARQGASSAITTFTEIDNLYLSDPVAAIFTSTATPPPDGEVSFDSTASMGDITGRAWTWGDGSAAGSGTTATHVYAGVGTFQVVLETVTRWNARYRSIQLVSVEYGLPVPVLGGLPIMPVIRLDGVDVCDLVYSITWQLGRSSWTEAYGGQTASVRLRGAYAGELMGKVLTVTARGSGMKLWSGWVDEVSVTRRPGIDGGPNIAETFIVAADSGSYLGKRHIEAGSVFTVKKLGGRLDDLNIERLKTNRAKWSGVAGTRFPDLKRKESAADKLRNVTYLDMMNDALQASIAFAFTDGAGRVTYAPWDAPAGVSSTPTVNFDSGADCASAVDNQRRALQSLVNRWTVGDGNTVDNISRSSIEAYGERAHSVAADVLASELQFPMSAGMFTAMDDPASAPVVTVPITDWDQASVTLEPLDIALWSGTKFAVMGVRHELDISRWTMTAYLDRNPWATRGASPP